jgi:hypothetical protein
VPKMTNFRTTGRREPKSAHIILELVCTKLVINESSKSNAVAKSLEKSHWVTEEEHGSEDEKDVLEHTRQSKDER